MAEQRAQPYRITWPLNANQAEQIDTMFEILFRDLSVDGSSTQIINNITNVSVDLSSIRTVGITIDGGGSPITTGVKGYIRVPWTGTIIAANIQADQTGAIVVDVWKNVPTSYPPTDANSITHLTPITIDASNVDGQNRDTILAGWTTSVSYGDIFAFNVDSASTITRVSISLEVEI